MPRTTFLVPRGAEARAVARGAPHARIVSIAAGASAARDAAALDALRGAELVVVTGLCGGLRELRAGSVVVYRQVADPTGTLRTAPAVLDAIIRTVPTIRTVDAWTAGHVVTHRIERAELARISGADVVDMEGTVLARALVERAVPFVMVRVVSDDASRDLPPIEDAIDADGRIRPLRLATAFVRAPRDAFAFARDAQRALRTLADVARALSSVRA